MTFGDDTDDGAEEFDYPEAGPSVRRPATNEESDSDSDDDAPEAVGVSDAKKSAQDKEAALAE